MSIVSILSTNGFSQQLMSLEDALSLTLQENISVKIKTNELDQIKNYEKVGVLGTLPRIIVNGSASGNKGTSSLEFATDDFPTLEDAESESKSISGNVGINYNLFNGLGSIYTYQKLKKQTDLKSTELSIQIEQVLLKTAKEYFDIAYLQENYNIIKELLDISKERYNRIKVQNEFGNASKLDLLSAEIDLNNDSINLMNIEFELQIAKNQLNQTLNRDLAYDFLVENKVEINRDLNYSDLNQETQKNNNNVLLGQYMLDISKKDKKINAVSILPRIEISAQYGYNQTESNTSIILDQTSIGLTGFLNFSWDIFDGLAKNKITQNTKIQIESNKLELQSIKQEIQKEFNASYKQYENSINLIDIEKRNQSTSEKFFERAKEQFYQGQLSRNDFRLAQIDLNASKNRLNQTLYNAKIAELNLYRLSGKIIQETSK
jgi:outer membrane protein TolC